MDNSFVYRISTGELMDVSGKIIAVGYSGHGEGVNNPLMTDIHNVGPLPLGEYRMEFIADKNGDGIVYEHKAPPVVRLSASPDTETYGRGGFLIHGDLVDGEVHEASHGCIIMPHETRVAVWARMKEGFRTLRVIA